MTHPSADDPALRALFWPLQTGMLALPATAPVLFLGARPGPWTVSWRQLAWQCEQPHRAFHDALQAQRIPVQAEVTADGFAATVLLPPRQREEARALLARAVRATGPGGLLMAAAANQDGARSLQADLQALAGPVQVQSKYKCRVVWTHHDPSRVDAGLLAQWLGLADLRQVDSGTERFWSRPGLFAWDRIDPASALLAAHLPATLTGRVADAGAGWGYLSMQLLRRCPSITAIELFEANARALAPARRNLAQVRADLAGRLVPEVAVHWHDVAAGLPGGFDGVVCNPPFHQGHGGAEVPHLGQAFIASAAQALKASGQLWLVANRQLPYEALLHGRFNQVRAVCEQGRYKVLQALGPRQ